MDHRQPIFKLLSPVALFLSGILAIPAAWANTETGQSARLSTSTMAEHREPASYPPLLDNQSGTARERTSSDRRQIAHLGDFWIYSAGVQLTFDYDHDGHYSGFGISFDVDTLFDYVPVYAVLYLSLNGGPWNEYAVTAEFTVSGSGSADEVFVQTELETGYPSGSYDHFIEIYDARTHTLLTNYGPQDSHYWQGLLFEGYDHDQFNFGARVSLDFTGAGTLDPLGLLIMPLAGIAGYLRRRTKAA